MSKRYDKAKEYTKKYSSQLAPCKYCGNTEIVICTDRGIFDNKYYWSVNCTMRSCDYTMDTSVRKAIKKWNERHKQEGAEE